MFYKGIEYKRIATFEDKIDADDKAKRFNGKVFQGHNKYGLVFRVYVVK